MRRTLIIIAGITLLIGVGIGIYLIFFNSRPGLTAGNSTFPSAGNDTGAEAPAPTTQALGVPQAGAGTEVAPRLVRITDRPVALGSVAIYVPAHVAATTTASTTTNLAGDPDVRVEYIERESGNVYGYQAHARTLIRLSNKTLPGVQEATWLPDGSQAYARFLEKSDNDDHINTYALPATGEGGYFLQQDLEQVLVTGSSTLITLLSANNGSVATISSASGTNARTLFSSALSALRIAFAGGNYIATTKASAKSDGYAFTVDPKSGSFTRVLGPLQGLTTLPSPSGKFLLYSYLDRGKLALGVLDLTTYTATRLPLATLPEKCVWAPDSLSMYCGVPTTAPGTLPDDWYQGVISFSDRIWKIDLSGRVATLVIDPKQAGNVDVDAVGLAVDRTNDVLLFTNKRDGTLYAYDL